MAHSISVILPNYNHAKYIKRAVNAMLGQSLLPGEIIIVDDGSTDNSISVIDTIARTSDLIRVIRNRENKGLVSAQKIGLARASGHYIYLAAADDWVLPNFFKVGVEALTRNPQAGLFAGDAVLVDGATTRVLSRRPIVMPSFKEGFIDAARARQLLVTSDNWILTGSALLLKDAIDFAGGLDEELGTFADGYLTRKIILTRGFSYTPRLVSVWSIFSTGMSRRTALNLDRSLELLRVASAKILQDPAFPQWYAELFCKRWRFAVSRLALHARPIQVQVLLGMLDNDLDRAVIRSLLQFSSGWFCRLTITFLLWFRLRPYRITDILGTRLFRRLGLAWS